MLAHAGEEAVALLPLAQFDLASPLAPVVVAADASESGAGVCTSKALSPSGELWLPKALATQPLYSYMRSTVPNVFFLFRPRCCDGIAMCRAEEHPAGTAIPARC